METKNIIIKRSLKIGELDAETDTNLLDKCFVDKGYLEELLNVNKPAAIVLGRTGSGKSALLYKIETSTEKNIRIDPHDISIKFLENSNIIQFFNALDIKLDLFYRLLWRHLLTVELLKLRYGFKNETDSTTFTEGFLDYFKKNPTKKIAFEYFKEWGSKFWLETEERLKEITSNLERQTKAQIGAEYSTIKLSLEGSKTLSEQQKKEITYRASKVVDGLQIKKLNDTLDLIAEHSFNDPQKKFYIIIDQLDENWADTETRCRFIRALIEEIKSFRKVGTVKIIVALRKDLLDLVFDKTRDSGFQEEKYESYILDIKWSADELKNLVEHRLNEVFKNQYTNSLVGFDDIFPNPRKKGGQTSFDFIVERTLRRPRDILQFINESFKIASERSRVSWRSLQAAEAIYSSKRLKSLSEEWSEHYPSLIETIEILRGMNASFSRSLITPEKLEDVMMSLHDEQHSDPCVEIVKRLYDSADNTIKETDVLTIMLTTLYKVGAIGIKISALDTFFWSYIDQPSISKSEAKRANQIKIHKMLYRALDVVLDQKDIFDKEEFE